MWSAALVAERLGMHSCAPFPWQAVAVEANTAVDPSPASPS